ncbi:hypothetical protein RvY_12977 [Ramazzottius varieornatus]|uniref:Uncharacterized protein n=1 Tax=Ramazzottius varieornatus TaxID=947166 RepID=A0A1D1VLB9_RAMVA|nr:hypothetical protein RvY_12977 [Ramazzottius varieornatus]
MNSDKEITMPAELKEKKAWISRELTNILLLGIGFMFSMGSYSTCAMSQAVVGLNGVFVGVGQLVGGMLFASLGKCAQKHERDPALVLGGMYLSIPASAPFMVTKDPTFIKPK